MNIIFDYDGTLHETLYIYKPAFLKAYDWLVKNGYAENGIVSVGREGVVMISDTFRWTE